MILPNLFQRLNRTLLVTGVTSRGPSSSRGPGVARGGRAHSTRWAPPPPGPGARGAALGVSGVGASCPAGPCSAAGPRPRQPSRALAGLG